MDKICNADAIYQALKAAGLKPAIERPTREGHSHVVRRGFVLRPSFDNDGSWRVGFSFEHAWLRTNRGEDLGPAYRHQEKLAMEALIAAGFRVEMRCGSVCVLRKTS